ncbi:hypothetical protein U1Q18_016144 [Sarracenia purpurea var. burkii]
MEKVAQYGPWLRFKQSTERVKGKQSPTRSSSSSTEQVYAEDVQRGGKNKSGEGIKTPVTHRPPEGRSNCYEEIAGQQVLIREDKSEGYGRKISEGFTEEILHDSGNYFGKLTEGRLINMEEPKAQQGKSELGNTSSRQTNFEADRGRQEAQREL